MLFGAACMLYAKTSLIALRVVLKAPLPLLRASWLPDIARTIKLPVIFGSPASR
nr:MAG TPA: hypothetical protein [Bacteriophage sp.]